MAGASTSDLKNHDLQHHTTNEFITQAHVPHGK